LNYLAARKPGPNGKINLNIILDKELDNISVKTEAPRKKFNPSHHNE